MQILLLNVPIQIQKNKDTVMLLLANLALTKFQELGCFQSKQRSDHLLGHTDPEKMFY